MTTHVKKVQITLYRSLIGNPEWMRKIVNTLGLRKLGRSVIVGDNAAIRGMVKKVPHLLSLKEVEG